MIELVFRITQLLSLLLACLHFCKHSLSLVATTSIKKILTVKAVLWVTFGFFNFQAAFVFFLNRRRGMALPQRILFPAEEICMDWQQRQRPGAGLCNLGSTCYINVILQCLTYTPPLANYLLSRDHSQLCHQQGFCMMCIMEAHVRKVLRSSANVIWPRAVIRDLKFIGEEFEPDMAGDAYEFLRCALEAMQRACLSEGSR
uniref:USP domain-containing protein n=1 Tax=Catharus ustulatus TaxID=91951 RepID=A0A8C3UVG3_CATUS